MTVSGPDCISVQRDLSPPMSRSYVTLAEHPTGMVRLACTRCERKGQCRKTTLRPERMMKKPAMDGRALGLRLRHSSVD
jgi:hypothetical protein